MRPEFVDVHKATVRVDHQRNANQYFTVRYLLDRQEGAVRLRAARSTTTTAAFTNLRTNYVNLNHKWVLVVEQAQRSVRAVRPSPRAHQRELHRRSPPSQVSGAFDLGSGTNYNPVTNHVVAFNDNFTWTMSGTRTGDHVLKTGAQLKMLRSDSFFDSNFRGTYTFPNLAAFLAGTPSTLHAEPG